MFGEVKLPKERLFVGRWADTFLLLGGNNRNVKVAGSGLLGS